MRRLLAIAVVSALMAAVAAPAHSATGVAVYNNYYAPTPARIEPGHEVTWTWSCDSYGGGCAGTHSVTAYQGATFNSGVLAYPATYTATVPSTSTVVRYRCTVHSSVSGTACNGMCGVLSTDTARPSVTMDDPDENQIYTATTATVPVRFAGGATDDAGVTSVKVRVYDLIGSPADYTGSCTGGCGGTSVAWGALASLLPGTYLAEAIATDVLGNTGTTTRVRFFVV